MIAATRAARQAAALATRLVAYGVEAIPEVQEAMVIARFLLTVGLTRISGPQH